MAGVESVVKLYVISGVTGMTGNELVHQNLEDKTEENHI